MLDNYMTFHIIYNFSLTSIKISFSLITSQTMTALPIKIVVPSHNKLFLAKNSLQDYGPIFKRNVNPKRKQSQLQQKQTYS